MGEVVLLTPVAPDAVGALQDYLRGLRTRAGERSPFALEPGRTHFARFVVLQLDDPQLLFTSRFDGDERTYLEALAGVPDACAVFEHCRRPEPVTEQTLRDYLMDNHEARLPVSYVVPWQEPASVAEINEAIELRAALRDLAQKSETLGAVGFAHELRQMRMVRRLLAR